MSRLSRGAALPRRTLEAAPTQAPGAGRSPVTMPHMRTALSNAIRTLVRDRGVTAPAVVLLALTLGTTAGIYAIVDAVLLRPLPFADQDRTVIVWQRDAASQAPVIEVALGEADAWRRDASRALDDLAVFGSVNWTLSIGDEHQPQLRVAYAAVSARFFDVVGAAPALGRTLRTDDQVGTTARTAVISDAFWRERFNRDPAAIGATLRAKALGLSPAEAPPDVIEIVGVMPAAFDFPRGARLWLPAAPLLRAAARGSTDSSEEAWNLSRLRVFYALGRLPSGVTPSVAAQVLTDAVRRGDDIGGTAEAVVTPVLDWATGPARPVLWVMQVGAALMLLLACSSVAGLMVFRAARQDRALAMHLALGASRATLLARSLLECGLLATLGALAAVGVAWGVVRSLVLAAPLDVPRLETTTVSASVLAGLAGTTLVVAVLTALWPAWFVSRVAPGPTLTTGARAAMHPRERRWQRLVVAWQVALAVVVLAGGALFVRSVAALDRTVLGFKAAGLTAIEVEPSAQDADTWDRFYDTLLARTRAIPGIREAAAVYLKPFSGAIGMDVRPVLIGQEQEGHGPDAPWRANPLANLEAVTPGYFATLGTQLIVGRDFAPTDLPDAPGVVIVSASAAARYWPGKDALGQQVVVPTQRNVGPRDPLRWMRVVGVVEDLRYRGVMDPRLDVYLPATQSTMRVKHLMVRADRDAGAPIAAVRALVRELDPAAHVGAVVDMRDALARETGPWRFAMRVLLGFGVLAAALAAIGLAAMVSLAVTLRRQELGIRAALGASPARLRWDALHDAVVVLMVAVVAGTATAAALNQLVASLLVETSPHDPLALVAAGALTLVLAVAATVGPAGRAARSDPAEALRQ